MQDSSGTVGPTPQEQALSANAASEFQRYQSKWLPLQDHLSDVVTSMGQPNSWQRQEAEGKGNTDVAQQFAQMSQQRTAASLDRGISPGSSAYKLGVAASATAEAEAKGAAVNTGNQAIDKAYLSGLTSISKAGEGLASSAMQGMGMGADVASSQAISNAEVSNASRASTMGAIGFGIGAIGASASGTGSSTPDTNFGFDPSTGIGGGANYMNTPAPAGTGIGGSSGRE